MGIPNYQYEPLTPPSSWNADEKRLLQRITDIFDDIYMKWGRLDSNHIAASGVKEKNIAPNAITDSKILSVDAAKVNRLDAVSFEAVTARIQDLAADLITTNGFTAKWAEIASAAISHLRVKYSDTEEAIIRDGIGGEIYIDRLTATSATFISATMGELVVKGDDGKYYEITVRSDGTINTDEVTVSGGEIAAGQTSEGKKIVETEIDVVALNAQNIKATSAIIGSIFTTALTAGKITAGEALISSATIPALYTTAINAIGNSMTLSANESINILVREKSILREASLPSDPVVGQTIVYTGVQPHEALQWTGKGANPTQRTYPATKSGAMVSFEDLSDRHALKVTVKTVATQAGSGTPSPANVRAISGKSSVTARRMGKNMFAPYAANGVSNGIEYTVNPDGSITLAGTASSHTYFNGPSFAFKSAGAVYCLSMYGADDTYRGVDLIVNGASGIYVDSSRGGWHAAAIAAGDYIISFQVRVLSGVTVNTTIYPQFEVGSAPTDYEHTHAAYIITPTATLYGMPGYEDEIGSDSHEIHNTHLYTFGGTGVEAAGYIDGNSTATHVQFNLTPGSAWVTAVNTQAAQLCSHFPIDYSAASPGINTEGIIVYNNANLVVLRIAKSRIAGWSDAWTPSQKQIALLAWLVGKNVQLLYRRATPATATNAPAAIAGADGANNVTSDSASVTVEYAASGWKRLSNSIIGSNIHISDERIRAQSDLISFGNDSNPENDAFVMEDGAVYAPLLESPCVAPAYYGPTAITIKPNATDDEIQAGTAYKSLAQLAAAVNRKWLPIPVTATVNADVDEYSDVVFNGIAGSALNIVGAGSYSEPSDSMPRHRGILYIQDCTARLSVQNLRIANSLTAAQTVVASVSGSMHVEFVRCVLDDTGNYGGTILYATQNAAVFANNCAFVNATGVTATAVRANYNGRISVSNALGDLSANTVLMNVWLGTIYWSGTAPVCANATVASSTKAGTATYSLGDRTPFRGTQGGGAASPVSMDLSPTLARAHLTEDGWGGALYQGYTPAKGRCTTCYWFNVSALAGKTILSASLKLHRYSGYGRNDGVVVRIHPINNASASGSLSRGAFIAELGKVSAGATREMELPTSVVEALIAGTYKAIGIYTGETQTMSDRLYSSNYGRWYGDAVLSVTYQ